MWPGAGLLSDELVAVGAGVWPWSAGGGVAVLLPAGRLRGRRRLHGAAAVLLPAASPGGCARGAAAGRRRRRPLAVLRPPRGHALPHGRRLHAHVLQRIRHM